MPDQKFVTPEQLRPVIDMINRGVKVDPSSVDVGLSLSGSTLTLTKPDGTMQTVGLPSGGGGGGEVPSLSTADLDNLMGL